MVTIVALVVVVSKIDWARLEVAVRGMGGTALALGAALAIPPLLLKIYRWNYLLQAGGYNAKPRDAIRSLLAGMGLALVTPSRIGELGRPFFLPDNRKWELGGLAVADKLFDAFAIGLAAVAGAGVLLSPLLGLGLIAAALAMLFMLLLAGLSGVTFRGFARLPYVGKRLAAPLAASRVLTPRVVRRCVLVSIGIVALTTVQFDLILTSMAPVPLRWAILVYPVMVLATMAPISVNGIGVREITAVTLMSQFGVDAGVSGLSAFVMFVVNLLVPGIIGLLLVGLRGTKRSTGMPPSTLPADAASSVSTGLGAR
jgi:uncharacterized membrane protein YbhN (UPF0104 family)